MTAKELNDFLLHIIVNFLLIIGFLYYAVFGIRFKEFLEGQIKSLGFKELNLYPIIMLTIALLITSWLLLWGRLPFLLFGFWSHR